MAPTDWNTLPLAIKRNIIDDNVESNIAERRRQPKFRSEMCNDISDTTNHVFHE
jgi:hypothetical protein